jgi:hypothetical protein
MSNDRLPELGGDGELSNRVKGLIPWLPNPYECDSCGVYCDATRAYDPQTAAFNPSGMAKAWTCPECQATYRRVEPWDG